MKIATWNVNGVRARREQLLEWLDEELPDIVCLQEIKVGPDKLPAELAHLPGWDTLWHGTGGYSGVALLVRQGAGLEPPRFSHPPFDFEQRAAVATLGPLTVASLYVPNGGKNYDDKVRFYDRLTAWADRELERGGHLVLAGDFNVALEERDVHPKERKVNALGQRPEERQMLRILLELGLTDLARLHAPEDDELFTWWAPWRNLRQRNIGWRIDYLLADRALAQRSIDCRSLREVGTSDHGPVVASFTAGSSETPRSNATGS